MVFLTKFKFAWFNGLFMRSFSSFATFGIKKNVLNKKNCGENAFGIVYILSHSHYIYS